MAEDVGTPSRKWELSFRASAETGYIPRLCRAIHCAISSSSDTSRDHSVSPRSFSIPTCCTNHTNHVVNYNIERYGNEGEVGSRYGTATQPCTPQTTESSWKSLQQRLRSYRLRTYMIWIKSNQALANSMHLKNVDSFYADAAILLLIDICYGLISSKLYSSIRYIKYLTRYCHHLLVDAFKTSQEMHFLSLQQARTRLKNLVSEVEGFLPDIRKNLSRSGNEIPPMTKWSNMTGVAALLDELEQHTSELEALNLPALRSSARQKDDYPFNDDIACETSSDSSTSPERSVIILRGMNLSIEASKMTHARSLRERRGKNSKPGFLWMPRPNLPAPDRWLAVLSRLRVIKRVWEVSRNPCNIDEVVDNLPLRLTLTLSSSKAFFSPRVGYREPISTIIQ